MYLAMSRQADREGFPEIAEAYKRIAFEEADHAAKFAELLGEVLWADTKKNLEARVIAEIRSLCGKKNLFPQRPSSWAMTRSMTLSMRCARTRPGTLAFKGLLQRFFS